MILTAACATRWWREEIQLEALAQRRFVHFADAALPRGAGVRYDDVDAAKFPHDLVERHLHRSRW